MGLLTESGSSGAVGPTPSSLLAVAGSSSVACEAMLQSKGCSTHMQQMSMFVVCYRRLGVVGEPAIAAAAASRIS